MSNPGAFTQILRSINIDDLRAIRRKYASGVSSGYNKPKLVRRLRDSLDGRINIQKLTESALEEAQRDRRQHFTRIKDALERLVFSENVTDDSTSENREKWMCSEAFQALRYELEDVVGSSNYTIEQEYIVKQEGERGIVDLCVTYDDGKERPMRYLIEAKRARRKQGMKRLINQIETYEERTKYWERSIGLIIVEREADLPRNAPATRRAKNKLESRRRTDYVLKRPSDFQVP